MPIVQQFDGVNRRIVLDPSIADSTWSPLDLFREYLAYRRDNEQFRGFDPLLRMRGGEPKGGGKKAPRFLQLQTDRRGILTKLVLPDTGPYRTLVDGEVATDQADSDPEPFDLSNITTAVVVDYKPAEAEIIIVDAASSGNSADLCAQNITVRITEDPQITVKLSSSHIRPRIAPPIRVGIPANELAYRIDTTIKARVGC